MNNEIRNFRFDISVEEYVANSNSYHMVFRKVILEQIPLNKAKIIFEELENKLKELLK